MRLQEHSRDKRCSGSISVGSAGFLSVSFDAIVAHVRKFLKSSVLVFSLGEKNFHNAKLLQRKMFEGEFSREMFVRIFGMRDSTRNGVKIVAF